MKRKRVIHAVGRHDLKPIEWYWILERGGWQYVANGTGEVVSVHRLDEIEAEVTRAESGEWLLTSGAKPPARR